MTFRTRFILLALFNCLAIIMVFWLFSRYSVDLSQRLIDLRIDTPKGLAILLGFISGALVNFLVNFALLSSRKSEFTYEQVTAMLQTASRSA